MRAAVVGAGLSGLTATLRTDGYVIDFGAVDFTHVHRWPKALPFTRIGAYKDIGRFIATLDPASPVQSAADFMSAAGQNTAVEFGSRAATNLTARRAAVSADR